MSGADMSGADRCRDEVAAMDRRHRLRARLWAGLACAALGALALWSAGFPPPELRAWWVRYWAERESLSASAPSTAPSTTTAPAAAIAPAFPAAPEDALRGIDSSLSEKPLPLILVSTLPGRNAREGVAMLGPDAANPQTYGAGALLENGARLVEIYPDRVVLERGARRVTLHLNGASKPGHLDRLSNAAARAEVAGEDDLDTVGGRREALLTRASSEDALSEVVRVQPAYEQGGLAGFQVYPGRRGDVFTRLGLQAGDVIQFIGGRRMTRDVQWQEIARSLAGGAAVEVTLTRGGQLVHLALDGLALAPDRHGAQGTALASMPEPHHGN